MGLLAALAVNEFLVINGQKNRVLSVVASTVPFAFLMVLSLVQVDVAAGYTDSPMTLISIAMTGIAVLWLLLFIADAIARLFACSEHPIVSLAYSSMAQVYITFPLLCVVAMSVLSGVKSLFWTFPLALYVFLWVNDSGAYLIGSACGKHKFFPRISPKKTWEGCIGGAVFTLAISLLYWRFFPILSGWQWLGMALIVIVFGSLGDLVESMMKRALGIKDSGNLIPGHGGILDRIDSMLFAAPTAFVYLSICCL